ncbi:tRNA pseudouridine(55) synthase TruB [Verrucomicrobiaceae bacterium N1E253]|uniref:tRNA pseudouridine synthase B n=1 Tax=Oceaniferula marina TaxID=2748318 RepID=A0A851GF54_9BACT|nr:tRNA pseudouridine(55) synthase TruB [Oceaniferula marina]NWK56163.1 tRNA pseudouridine(55) synthase TruB [Oceaniferula marina]
MHSTLNTQHSTLNAPCGVLLIDKEPDMTSHDAVAICRRQLKFKKIGHCGTLDPMATGLLMLVIGKATKIQDLLMAEDKEYIGTLKLGATTNSQDKDGEIEEEKEVPAFTDEQIDLAFNEYVGKFEQIPPMVSAIKKDGVPLYKLARKGKVVKRDPRPVYVTDYSIDRIALPEVDFTVQCSKGFYVRTYAHDIGQDLNCGAHLTALRRTRSGKFTLDRAMTAAELKTASAEEIQKAMISLAEISLMRGA